MPLHSSRSSGKPLWVILIVLALLLSAATAAVAVVPAAQESGSASPTIVTTDVSGAPKTDFAPSEVVYARGQGFAPNTVYQVPVMRPNGSVGWYDPDPVVGKIIVEVTTEMMAANPDVWHPDEWEEVTSDANGDFIYEYNLNGILGLYELPRLCRRRVHSDRQGRLGPGQRLSSASLIHRREHRHVRPVLERHRHGLYVRRHRLPLDQWQPPEQ